MPVATLLIGMARGADVADCVRTFDAGDIVDAAASAESAFERMDAPAFAAGREAMETRLACAGEKLSLDVIARFHRVEALAALVDHRDDRVPQALAGVFAAEPGHQIPTSLVPDDHPIRAMIPQAMTALREDDRVHLPKLTSGWFDVDGSASQTVPARRASLVEQIDSQNAVIATHYRWPDDAGFAWVVLPSAPTKARPRGPWARRVPLVALSGAALATSGVLLALAADARSEFDDAPTLSAAAGSAERDAYLTELEAVQRQANGLSVSSYATAGAGLTLGIITVIAW